MKKVIIEPGCTTCGLCAFIAPDVFEVSDKAHVKREIDYEKNQQDIMQAAQACPVNVIKIKDTDL